MSPHNKATPQEKKLLQALRKELRSEYDEGVLEVHPQYWDGYKTIDIRIIFYDDYDEEVGGFDIEVDGSHHTSSKQLLSVINRTRFSQDEGYDTIRIPNWIIDNKLEEVTNSIAQAVRRELDEICEEDKW